jgi:hypothetical protein
MLDFLLGRKQQAAAQNSAADRDFEVGVHESGHAVISRMLGHGVSLISIVENEKLGRAGVTISGDGGWPDLAMGRSVSDSYARIDKMASIIDRHKPREGENRDIAESWLAAVHVAAIKLMAGVAGEILIFGKANDRRAAGDYSEASRLSLTIATNSRAAQAFMEFAGVEAIEMLRPYSAVVRALAEELVLKRQLSGAEADRIIAAALAVLAHDQEAARQADWRRVMQSAAAFPGDRAQ